MKPRREVDRTMWAPYMLVTDTGAVVAPTTDYSARVAVSTTRALLKLMGKL